MNMQEEQEHLTKKIYALIPKNNLQLKCFKVYLHCSNFYKLASGENHGYVVISLHSSLPPG